MKCAVWYYSHHVVYFELFDSERDAVWFASSMQDSGDGAVKGIQYDDGSFVEREAWQALKDYEDEQYRRIEAEVRAEQSKPQPPVYKVTPPFTVSNGCSIANTQRVVPAWLGKH